MKMKCALHTDELNPLEIAELAFATWQKEGCPQSRLSEHWLMAKARLAAKRRQSELGSVEQPAAAM
ncbi:MAG: DUF2934 domain-containing protein [Verrucomicrobia bacterium]|nr:DUF2934 domain-containing protein [Verrucomicrobiota bacterium]